VFLAAGPVLGATDPFTGTWVQTLAAHKGTIGFTTTLTIAKAGTGWRVSVADSGDYACGRPHIKPWRLSGTGHLSSGRLVVKWGIMYCGSPPKSLGPHSGDMLSGMASYYTIHGAGGTRFLSDELGGKWLSAGAALSVSASTAHVAWEESVPSGTISVSGRAGGAIAVQLLAAGSSKPLAQARGRPDASGAFSASLTVPKTILPGKYAVHVTSGATSVDRPILIPRPQEGIVSDAFISTTRGGPPILALSQEVEKLWVRFKFALLPAGHAVTAFWKTPDGRSVAVAVKPATPIVDTDVSSSAPLPKGTWQAVLEANGKVVRRVSISLR